MDNNPFELLHYVATVVGDIGWLQVAYHLYKLKQIFQMQIHRAGMIQCVCLLTAVTSQIQYCEMMEPQMCSTSQLHLTHC